MTDHAATVLTIDDDDLVRRAFKTCLQAAGFRAIDAPDGSTGLQRFRNENPDVVLCDLRMPGLDGLEVLTRIRDESPETPVIVVSGEGTMDDAVKALKRGAWDFVTKPLHDVQFLIQSVDRALEKARLERQNRAYRLHLEQLNEKLRKALAELRADQEAGRKVQFELLPQPDWTAGSYIFDRRIFPSAYLSGDFVDYFSLNERHTGMYVADVSGHGAASAFITAMLTTLVSKHREGLVRGENDILLSPERFLSTLDKDLGARSLDKHLTMFYAVLDHQTHELTYASAGHFPFPVLFDGQSARFLGCSGRPLGLFPDCRVEAYHAPMAPGARLLVASDGVLELGATRSLQEKKQRLSSLTKLHKTITGIVEALALTSLSELRDDVALLLVRREP